MVLRVSGQRMVPKEAATAVFKHVGTLLGTGLLQWSSMCFGVPTGIVSDHMLHVWEQPRPGAGKPQQW